MMSVILIASGFQNLESLQEFSLRYPNISSDIDSELKRIWISHKNSEFIPKFEGIVSLQAKDYNSLYSEIKKRLHYDEHFVSGFKAMSIFQKIFTHFKGYLTTYIFKNCYIFYNWGFNSFEPVIDQNEIHKKIERGIRIISAKKNQNSTKNNCYWVRSNKSMFNSGKTTEQTEKSFCMVKESDSTPKCFSSKRVTIKSFKNAILNCESYTDLPRNPNDPCQETFNLKKILYDMHQKPKWPVNHILSTNDAHELLIFVIQLPVESKISVTNKLLQECNNWVKLKDLLRQFLKKHKTVEKNNGYGKILKKHLKSVKTTKCRRLIPIPKSTVCSYCIDIIRRVLPYELFGSNRHRKKFFSCLVKIINGSKEENFIWHSLLRFLFQNKSEMIWCTEINDDYSQNQVILKLFKFIIIHYVFNLLKNNFYVTETGSSGFALRFYRKSDVESASSVCIDNLLYYKHISLFKKRDYDLFTLERKWVDTGVIDQKDLNRNPERIMSDDTEFKQPIARVRFLPKNDWSDEMRILTNLKETKKSCSLSTTEGKELLTIFEARSARRKKTLHLVKLFLEFLLHRISFGIIPVPNNPKLETAWNKAIHLKENFGKLYFVKADIADAFLSIKHDILINIIKEILEEESLNKPLQLKNITEWRQTKSKIEKITRLSFSNLPRENSILINRTICHDSNTNSNKGGNLDFVNIIKQVVMQQRIEIKGRVFKLIKGLAQGSVGKFSPQLSEIYYSSMDKLYFEGIINSRDSVLLRGVDDYLLLTSNERKAKYFLDTVRGGIEHFNARFNKEKLKSNLLEDVHEFQYLGLIFNLDDMSVKPNYSKFKKTDFLSTMKLSDIRGNVHFNKNHFLERRSLRINGLKLQQIFLNKNHNNLKIIRQNVFQACLIQSLRVIALARYLYERRSKNDLFIWKILLESCAKIKKIVCKLSGISKDEVKWLFLFAASCTLQKYCGQFKYLLVMVRFKLQNCERTFLNNGDELLLEFLKNDLHLGEDWKKLTEILGRFSGKCFGSQCRALESLTQR